MRLKNIVKKIILDNAEIINRLPTINKIGGGSKSNKISFSKCLLYKCNIKIIGENNEITFLGNGRCQYTNIYIYGNNNKLIIKDNFLMKNGQIQIEDDSNCVEIGKNVKFCGKINIGCIESTNIGIGDNCLFSSDINISTGDSHSILNKNGQRINKSLDVSIGEHVWIGHHSIINKGATISDNSIVGSGAIVTKKFDENNVILAGVPAKVIKKEINWNEYRI